MLYSHTLTCHSYSIWKGGKKQAGNLFFSAKTRFSNHAIDFSVINNISPNFVMPAYQIEKCSCWLTHVYTCTYKRDFLKWGKLCLCRQRNSVIWLIRLIFNLLAVLETIITYDWSLICCIIGKLNGTVRIHNTLRKMGLNICVFKPAGQANTVYIEGMQCRQLTTETLTKRVSYEQNY